MRTLSKVPLFSLPDQDGNPFNIADYLGKKKLVIFFYPKNETPACTKEACAFRDSFEVFTEAGAFVIGISADSVKSHQSFRQHHHLPYTLLSDKGNKVAKMFGVSNFLFVSGRETFVVDPEGNVVFHFKALFKGDAHVQEVLRYLSNHP